MFTGRVGLVTATVLIALGSSLVSPTAASADTLPPSACSPAGGGGYGFDVGVTEDITPVGADYAAFAYTPTQNCVTAQLALAVIPSEGTTTTCTLYFPQPVLSGATGCDQVDGTPGFVVYYTPVQMRAVFTGVDTMGHVNVITYSCTVIAPRNTATDGIVPLPGGSLLNPPYAHVSCPI